jgi:hypothetical protein
MENAQSKKNKNYVGNAWKQTFETGKPKFVVSLKAEDVAKLPVNDQGEVAISLAERKELGRGNVTHAVYENTYAATQKKDTGAEMVFRVNKEQFLKLPVSEQYKEVKIDLTAKKDESIKNDKADYHVAVHGEKVDDKKLGGRAWAVNQGVGEKFMIGNAKESLAKDSNLDFDKVAIYVDVEKFNQVKPNTKTGNIQLSVMKNSNDTLSVYRSKGKDDVKAMYNIEIDKKHLPELDKFKFKNDKNQDVLKIDVVQKKSIGKDNSKFVAQVYDKTEGKLMIGRGWDVQESAIKQKQEQTQEQAKPERVEIKSEMKKEALEGQTIVKVTINQSEIKKLPSDLQITLGESKDQFNKESLVIPKKSLLEYEADEKGNVSVLITKGEKAGSKVIIKEDTKEARNEFIKAVQKADSGVIKKPADIKKKSATTKAVKADKAKPVAKATKGAKAPKAKSGKRMKI